jgi:hypothetical protein
MVDSKRTLICATRRTFVDDKQDRCSICLRSVFFRPHSAWIGRRLCLPCGMKEAKENHSVPEMTNETRRELKSLGIL